MKRLVYIISTFLFVAGMYGGNVGADSIFQFTQEGGGTSVGGRFSGSSMPDSHRQKYLGLLDFRKRSGWSVALAVAPNGWVLGLGFGDIGFGVPNILPHPPYPILNLALHPHF